MQCLPKCKVLEFHTDTLEAVRKIYNLHKPGDMSNAVDILDAWAREQKHFTKKDFDRGYLERKIIGCKGSVERAKERLDNICTYRTLMPQYFGDFDIRKELKSLESLQCAVLPKLTKDHQRLILCKTVGSKLAPTILFELCTYMFLSAEANKAIDYTNGYMVFLDFRYIDWMDAISKLYIDVLRQGLTILLGGYEARINAVHIYTSSNLVDLAVVIFKPFLSAKIASRIYVHHSLEEALECLPKDILPEEYGGKEKPLTVLEEEWKDFLSSKERREYVREMCKARTDESLRQKGRFNEMYMGTPGTFRAFNVD